MSSYVRSATNLIVNTQKVSKATFTVLQGLDESIHRLALLIDRKQSNLPPNPSAAAVDDIKKLCKLVDELIDRKIRLVVNDYDLIDNNMKIVDKHIALVQNLIRAHPENIEETFKAQEGLMHDLNEDDQNKKKRKVIGLGDPSSGPTVIVEDFMIDPNEPHYCICKQVAYGEMIACDDEECDIEWYHLGCVGLTKTPRNNWLCPSCTAKRKR